jgi:nucleoside-diphosphate-sugar epimerase
MRVAVTGASGYIGGWLLAELAARGHEVHAQDMVLPDNQGQVDLASFSDFDLLRSDTRRAWLGCARPEVVIHLAALYGRVWGEQDMVKTAGINAGLTAVLARECASLGIPVMYMSSSEVYGASADRGTVYPGSLLEPYNMYGLSKKWGEEACRRYAPDGLMVSRLNMPYGPAFWYPKVGARTSTSGQPGTVGYNVLHSMVWQAHHNLDLVAHRGTTRCLTWIEDTCRGLADIMEAGQAGTWNVCRNDLHHQVEDIAWQVAEMTGTTSRVIVEDPPPRVTMHKSLDNAELLDLGWRPKVELEEGMRRTWEYYRRFSSDGTWLG